VINVIHRVSHIYNTNKLILLYYKYYVQQKNLQFLFYNVISSIFHDNTVLSQNILKYTQFDNTFYYLKYGQTGS